MSSLSRSLFLSAALAASLPAAETLRVRLFRDQPPLTLRLALQSGRTISLNGARPPAQPIRLNTVKWIEADGRHARTVPPHIEIVPAHGRLMVRAILDLEDYVAAVLADEAYGRRSPECDKAVAVVVRSYALRNIGRHKQDGFDLCDTWHCQRFRFDSIPAGVRRAVKETQGEVMLQGSEPAPVFYHKDCGGHTESADAAWGVRPMTHLLGIADPLCERSSKAWQYRLSNAKLRAALQLKTEPVIEITQRSASGRVLTVAVNGKKQSAVAFEMPVARALGRPQLPGGRYQIRRDGNDWLIEGRGWGHGVGMCQQGAGRRAEAGQQYRDILSAYFPGAWIGSTSSAAATSRIASSSPASSN